MNEEKPSTKCWPFPPLNSPHFWMWLRQGSPHFVQPLTNLASVCRAKGDVERAEAREKEIAAAKAKTTAQPSAGK